VAGAAVSCPIPSMTKDGSIVIPASRIRYWDRFLIYRKLGKAFAHNIGSPGGEDGIQSIASSLACEFGTDGPALEPSLRSTLK